MLGIRNMKSTWPSGVARQVLLGLGLLLFFITYIIYNETSSTLLHANSAAIDRRDKRHAAKLKSERNPPVIQACSDEDLATVRQHFPPRRISSETKCPDSTAWLDKYLQQTFFPTEYDGKRPLIAISLGCNKGDDAVDTLQKLSRGGCNVSVPEFRSAFAHQASLMNGYLTQKSNASLLGKRPLKRACPDCSSPENGGLYSFTEKEITDVFVHCVEAMPTTAWILQQSAGTFPLFKDKFVVTHAAMSAKDGKMYFPTALAGIEHLGLGHCMDPAKRDSASCQLVPALTVDTFVRERVIAQSTILQSAVQADRAEYRAITKSATDDKISSAWNNYRPRFMIDMLMVDVEGYDWQVLGQGGANWTLRHTRYLEFEYHGTGAWNHDKLSVAIEYLDRLGYTCYWAGRGRLVRITGCFQGYMEVHEWSNVACVNRYLQPNLALQMETVYKETLAIWKQPSG